MTYKSKVLRWINTCLGARPDNEAASNPNQIAVPDMMPVPLSPMSPAKTPMGPRTMMFYQTAQRFSTLIAHSPLAVIEWDSGRHITRWMGNAEKIFGWSGFEVIGKRLDEFGLVYPEDAEAVRIALDGVERGESSVVRNRNCCKNGTVIHCEWYNSALMDESGKLVCGLSLALDVTGRHQMEETLRTSEEKYRNVFEDAPIGIFQSTTDGRFLNVNARLAAMFRFESPEQMVRSVRSISAELFVDPEQRHRILRQVEETGRYVQSEVEYRRRDGSIFVCKLYIRAVHVANGATFLEGFVEDITERKRAEEALHQVHLALERRVAERTAQLSAANERLKELDRLKS